MLKFSDYVVYRDPEADGAERDRGVGLHRLLPPDREGLLLNPHVGYCVTDTWGGEVDCNLFCMCRNQYCGSNYMEMGSGSRVMSSTLKKVGYL